MKFNTESGGPAGSGDSSRESSGASPREYASPGGEFDHTDPVQSFINTVRHVVTAPVGFFRDIIGHRAFVNPLIFAIICYDIEAILHDLPALAGISGNQGSGSVLDSLILAPILAAIGLFIRPAYCTCS
jgi:hypothetical protein